MPTPVDLDLTSLRWSMAVVRLGGFRRAAESLGVEQSAVSRRIRGLEEELGVSLFHRSTRGAEPTNAGRQFLRRVDALLNGLRLAISDARAAGAGQSGHLRIGLTFSMLSDGLFNLIERFHGAHPAVTIEMVEGRAIDHLDAVADRRLDVAMLPEGMTVTGLDVSVLWRERLLIALPVNHPCAAAEVVCVAHIPKAKLLISERDIGRSLFSEIARRHQAELEVDIQDAGAGLLLEQTRMGLGLTLLGSGVLSSLKSDGALVFRPLAFEREEPLIVAAAWSPGNDNPALRRFVSSAKRLAASSKSGD